MEIPAPLELHRAVVLPEWIDYNEHMNVAFYVLAFDQATDALLDYLGLDDDYKTRTNTTTFVLDMNVGYRREVLEGDPLRITTRILDCDEKRIHSYHQMFHAEQGYLAATNELLQVHIDTAVRRIAPMAPEVFEFVQRVKQAHEALPRPEDAGRSLGIRRRKSP